MSFINIVLIRDKLPFRSFLEDLKKAECDPSETANCFRLHYSGFSVYNEYCTNYPRTMDVLVKLTRDENMAVLFREKQLKLHHALPLGSYLLKPVQRILKYHLLLQVKMRFSCLVCYSIINIHYVWGIHITFQWHSGPVRALTSGKTYPRHPQTLISRKSSSTWQVTTL